MFITLKTVYFKLWILYKIDKVFRGTVVNRASPSLLKNLNILFAISNYKHGTTLCSKIRPECSGLNFFEGFKNIKKKNFMIIF